MCELLADHPLAEIVDAVSRPYSTQFFEGHHLVNGVQTLCYTVPPGFVAVLRRMTAVFNGSPSSHLYLIDNATGLLFNALDATTAPEVFDLDTRIVWNAGQELAYYADTASWDLILSGYLLSA